MLALTDLDHCAAALEVCIELASRMAEAGKNFSGLPSRYFREMRIKYQGTLTAVYKERQEAERKNVNPTDG